MNQRRESFDDPRNRSTPPPPPRAPPPAASPPPPATTFHPRPRVGAPSPRARLGPTAAAEEELLPRLPLAPRRPRGRRRATVRGRHTQVARPLVQRLPRRRPERGRPSVSRRPAQGLSPEAQARRDSRLLRQVPQRRLLHETLQPDAAR